MSLQTLLERRTIRAYDLSYEIPEDVLRQIVEAVQNSPSALNYQGIDLVVCTNREKLMTVCEEVLNSCPEGMRNRFLERQKATGVKNAVMYDAPCVIFLVKSERCQGGFTDIDAGIISMAIMVAAKSVGLDSVCLGSVSVGMTPKVEELLGIQRGACPVGVAIGKARSDAEPVKKEIINKVTYVK
ncbi:nitroreductase family protein [Tritrichomonas foetus]|uniref:Nitroreductase family protein n=1 Tax=Tritrichomonas foetus TaxID=1144522 RepID=A0A1J4KS85_9EUKA|nr:nitroreductase family protein [Tritrichomonas foetus]|eukprot:OHT14143.1 nitroreductase family protein [Tritrichomonas foetus]